MKITANVATYPPRIHSLKQMIASIYDQVDEIRVCMNEYLITEMPGFLYDLPKVKTIFPVAYDGNLTDNGKFFALDSERYMHPEVPEYYFSMDDDIIYPPDYVEHTIKNIQEYGMIITYHGRILNGKGKNYYTGHQAFKCLSRQTQDFKIDVAGTGVTAFDTRYFHPKGLSEHKLQRMSDLIFSLAAAEQGKKIGCCKRDLGWIKCIMHDENIYDTESKNGIDQQNKLADKIFDLNYE